MFLRCGVCTVRWLARGGGGVSLYKVRYHRLAAETPPRASWGSEWGIGAREKGSAVRVRHFTNPCSSVLCCAVLCCTLLYSTVPFLLLYCVTVLPIPPPPSSPTFLIHFTRPAPLFLRTVQCGPAAAAAAATSWRPCCMRGGPTACRVAPRCPVVSMYDTKESR